MVGGFLVGSVTGFLFGYCAGMPARGPASRYRKTNAIMAGLVIGLLGGMSGCQLFSGPSSDDNILAPSPIYFDR